MPNVFVSYSHKDSATLDRLRVHLKPLVDRGLVDFWDDTRIAPGASWNNEIQQAIERADFAVLVISADFVASDFVTKHELPHILARHLREETELLPVFWGASSANMVSYAVPGSATPLRLSEIQGFGTPDRPLATWNKSNREREFARLARHILSRADSATKLPAAAARGPAATTTGEAARRDYELVVRLDRKADAVEIRYEHPDAGALGVKPQRADLRAAQEISRELAVARTEVLEARLARATSDWGPQLLKLLFPQVDQVLRAVYERGAADPQPTPAYGAVRVWIVTDDAMLAGLPWRLTAWDGRLLLDLDWTLAVTRNPKPSRHVTTRPPESALIIAPRAGATDGAAAADAVVDALKLAWGSASRPYVVATRSEVQNALDGGLRPHIVFVHGHVAMRAGRAALLLDGASGDEPLPIAQLARLLQGDDAASAPAVIYLDVTRDEVEATAFEPLLALSPLVVWRGVPQAMPDSTSRAVVWLRRWLTESNEGYNPLMAWRDAHWEDATKAVEAATVVLHADFRTWRTELARGATPSEEARLVLDRRRPKAAIAADVRELMQRDARRVLAFVACASRGNLIAHFGEQLEHYLQVDIGAQTPLRRVILQLPPEREALYDLLARELRLQLKAGSSDPLNMLLQRTAPTRGSKGRPLLWLDWGVCGDGYQRPLTEIQIGEWARFGAEFIASQSPADIRVVTSLHVELKSQDTCKRVLGILQRLRVAPWYTHASPAYRLAELDALDVVTENELLEFLGTQPDCPRGLRPELAQLVHRETNGHFDRTVELLEEGQKGSWYALAARLRGGHTPIGDGAADEELR